MTVSLDGEPLGYLQNGRFWKVKVKAGEHTVSDKNPADYFKLTIEPDKIYYLRGEFVPAGILGFNARFSMTDPATAQSDIRRVKAGDANQITDKFNRISRTYSPSAP